MINRSSLLSVWFRINIKSEIIGPPKEIWNGPLFIHIPKTAGSSIIYSGAKTVFGHKTLQYYLKWCPSNIQFPLTFTIIRNPYDRIFSAYHFLKNGGKNEYDRMWARKYIFNTKDINEFIEDKLHDKRVLNWIHFRSQTEFVTNKSGNIAVDHLIKFEELKSKWPKFAINAGLKHKLPLRNKTNYNVRNVELNEKSKRLIANIYRQDFESLNYKIDIE